MTRREFNQNLVVVAAAVALARPGRAVTATQPMFPLTAVDTHAHIFRQGLKLADSRRYAPDYDANLADFLALLDRHGMSHGVLVQPSFLGTDNSFLVAALRAHPQRLRGIAVVEPTISAEALAELAATGVVGIRLNLVGAEIPDVKMGPWPTLLQRLVKLDWQVEVQREAKDLPRIVGPLLNAGLKVVVDHFGRPDPKLGVADPGFRYLLTTASTQPSTWKMVPSQSRSFWSPGQRRLQIARSVTGNNSIARRRTRSRRFERERAALTAKRACMR